jgi:hypothetical protein
VKEIDVAKDIKKIVAYLKNLDLIIAAFVIITVSLIFGGGFHESLISVMQKLPKMISPVRHFIEQVLF